jgi:hypothetical protein
MMAAGRRVVHGARTGGRTTHDERAEWASATPETRAQTTVWLLEEQHGSRAPAAVLARMADDAEGYARALRALAEARSLDESGSEPPAYTLEEIADATTRVLAEEPR